MGRCPPTRSCRRVAVTGEGVVETMLAVAVHALAELPHAVADDQDLGYDLSEMPTRPASGVVLRVGTRPA